MTPRPLTLGPIAVTLLLFSLVLSAAVSARAEHANLTPNPGFEEGQGDRPAHWSFYSWQQSSGWWEAEQVYAGRHSLGLRGLNGGWQTDFAVDPEALCRLSLRYRTNGVSSRLVVFVRVPTGNRKYRTIVYRPLLTQGPDERGRFVDGAYLGGADERGWVQVDLGELRLPAEVASVNLLLKINSQDAEAKLWIDDLCVEKLTPPALPDTARRLCTAGEAVVWTEDVNRKVFPEQQPPPGSERPLVEVSAARGEYESFQLVVTSASAWRQVRWDWTDFQGPAALPHAALRCRLLECVDIREPLGPHSHRGLNPDALTDRLPADLAAGVSQGFWFTVRVPPGQPKGDYEAVLRLLQKDREVARVTLRLHVFGFSLPDRPSLDVRSNLRPEILLKRESGDPDQVLKRYYTDLYEHRSRCSPGVPLLPRVVEGRVRVDLDRYVAHLKFMRDALGATRFDLPLLWISHGGEHTLRPDQRWLGQPLFADPQCTRLTAEFAALFRQYANLVLTRLREEGVLFDPHVRFFDEPNLRDAATVNGLRALAELVNEVAPEATVTLTATHPLSGLTDAIRLWVLHTDAWDANYPAIQRAREKGCQVAVYNNGVNFPEHRRLRVRLWPWLLRKYDVEGTYSWWGTLCWRGDLADPWTCGKGSSGVLLYPPRSPEEHGPLDSVRWELFREGLEDYEYLRLAGEVAASGRGARARRAGRAVEAALSLVTHWPVVRAANDEPYTLDVTEVNAARHELAAVIEAGSIAQP